MEINLETILNSLGSIQELSTAKPPLKTAYRISKISRKLQREIDLYNETVENLRKTFIEVYKKQNDGQDPQPDTRLPEESINEIKELLSSDVSLDIEKIKLEDLGDIKLSISCLSQLWWLIEE